MRWFWGMLLGLVLGGCSDCIQLADPGSNLVFTFFDLQERNLNNRQTARRVNFSSVVELNTGFSFPIPAITTDSINYRIPLPPERTEAILVFTSPPTDTMPTARIDTVEVTFNRQVVVITPDCGVIEEILDIQIVRTSFDPFELISNRTQANGNTNVRVFY
jgi:hypothetical protein